MNNIIEPNDRFDFSQLTLAHPSGVQGGAYFTKIEYNSKPLYIQTIKSLTRQGFVKTGKKYYCDLMFDKNAETLIHWFENLEEKCRKLIYEKKDTWFQNTLEESDIETAFTPLIRVYKSGKYYLLRTNIRNTRSDEPSIKIYNENEVALNIQDVTHETNIISILEIQGIKFTSRNFQIEVEMKQVMVLDNEPLFDNCLIKSKNGHLDKIEKKESITEEKNIVSAFNQSPIVEPVEQLQLEQLEPVESLESTRNENQSNTAENDQIVDLDLDLEELVDEDDSKELKEVDFDFDFDLETKNSEDTLKLKKPNQVYFDLYKQARKKAKEAKRNAIIAYLEAKNIKKTYMIENLNESDSDSELDAEIEEVSESELY